MVKEYTSREVKSILKRNGFYFLREAKGSHTVYSNGIKTISIPTKGSGKAVNKMMFLRLVKENSLNIEK